MSKLCSGRSLRIHSNLPFETIDALECPGYGFCIFVRGPFIGLFKIHEQSLEFFAKPSQHSVCHPPVLYPHSIFALADMAGVYYQQPLDRRQRPSTMLELQKTLGFCKKAFLKVGTLK
jgi:hypothetical protein